MAHHNHATPIMVVALLTTCVGLFFKIAAVPFHQWLPDAYEGAPTSVTGFMSVAVKAAALGHAAAHFDLGPLSRCARFTCRLLIFVSIATMTAANLAALTQNNLKRLLAYSSIAHVGYMLLGSGGLRLGYYPAPGDGRRPQRHTALPAGLHLHEPGRVRRGHLVAPARRDRRRDRRHRRPVLPRPHRSGSDADLSACRWPAFRRWQAFTGSTSSSSA